jgi:SAM-dependent methyltransferase
MRLSLKGFTGCPMIIITVVTSLNSRYTPLLPNGERSKFSVMPTVYRQIFGLISPLFRQKRLAQFEELLKPSPDDIMLDVGGATAMWENSPPSVAQVHILNLDPQWIQQEKPSGTPILPLVGNALTLPSADSEYDIVFSNSVIEHVGTWENQLKFAEEVRRTGKRLWIQTPAREFFIEPHYLTPFIHWLPKSLQRSLLRYFSVWGWLNRPTPRAVADMVDEIRLLTHAEMKVLFPDCEILQEKLWGMTKSYIAFRD